MKDKKYVHRSYWVHQYEKEEEFLSDMRSKGWKFVALYKGLPTKYEFEACEPEDYVYQLDYVETENDTEDYHQLFQDAGWTEIMPWPAVGGKWYYFCKKSGNAKERIYTDAESRYQMVDKLWKRFSLFLLVCILLELNGIRGGLSIAERGNLDAIDYVTGGFMVIFTLATIFMIYNLVAMFIVRHRLKKECEEADR